jgi:hypothetical protein
MASIVRKPLADRQTPALQRTQPGPSSETSAYAPR